MRDGLPLPWQLNDRFGSSGSEVAGAPWTEGGGRRVGENEMANRKTKKAKTGSQRKPVGPWIGPNLSSARAQTRSAKAHLSQGERMGRITKTLASTLIPSPHPCTRASGSCFPRLRGRAAAARARPDIERRRRRHGASSGHSPESSLPRGDAGRRRPDLVPEGVGSCGGGEGGQRGRSRRPEEEQTEAGGRAQGGRRGSTRRPAGLRWAARLSERPEERRSFADSSAARR